ADPQTQGVAREAEGAGDQTDHQHHGGAGGGDVEAELEPGQGLQPEVVQQDDVQGIGHPRGQGDGAPEGVEGAPGLVEEEDAHATEEDAEDPPPAHLLPEQDHAGQDGHGGVDEVEGGGGAGGEIVVGGEEQGGGDAEA